MPLEPHPTTLDSIIESLAGYPGWLVAAVLTVVAALVIWLLVKLLKWTLYVLLALVVVGGVAATIWLIFH